MTIFITEGEVTSIQARNLWKQDNFAINYSNPSRSNMGKLFTPKERNLSAISTFIQGYGGTKVTLTTKIKKGAGKGKLRAKVFYRKGNTFENLTWGLNENIQCI